ncbi:hypothetical protein HDU96_006018 [Phlyctochytrium bullatum]|nr:hypothetical protein HDU96_006018 [Phlyctochytrium bullatum]
MDDVEVTEYDPIEAPSADRKQLRPEVRQSKAREKEELLSELRSSEGRKFVQPSSSIPEIFEEGAAKQAKQSSRDGHVSVDSLLPADGVAMPTSSTLWADQTNLTQSTRRAMLNHFKYESMTEVQKQVCSLLPTKQDLLVRAKTGTGKTLAFLVGAYENVMANGGFDRHGASILVLSPTRELALQIATEAKRFVMGQGLRVQSLIGGEDRKRQKRALLGDGRVDIIVGTPGRLIDFLSSENSIRRKFETIKVVVFDEADQLLDMGFRDDMEQIASYLPKDRQTFMFSATLSTPIRKIAREILKEGHQSLDTVSKDDVPTHLLTKQSYVVSPFSQQLAVLYKAIVQHRQSVENSKVIVFFNTTKSVQLMADLFNTMPDMDVISIHSKLEQIQRSRISDRFRKSRSSILFTSDVSARGVDYPGVTLVIQVGVPSSTEQYIHRVGRTGRAGKSGEGLLIVSPYEKKFISSLTGKLPLKINLDLDPNLLSRDEVIQERLSQAFKSYDNRHAREAFTAYLGYYRQLLADLGITRETFYRSAEDYAKHILRLPETPRLNPRYAANMGLSRVRGVKLYTDGYEDEGPRSSFGAANDSPHRTELRDQEGPMMMKTG